MPRFGGTRDQLWRLAATAAQAGHFSPNQAGRRRPPAIPQAGRRAGTGSDELHRYAPTQGKRGVCRAQSRVYPVRRPAKPARAHSLTGAARWLNSRAGQSADWPEDSGDLAVTRGGGAVRACLVIRRVRRTGTRREQERVPRQHWTARKPSRWSVYPIGGEPGTRAGIARTAIMHWMRMSYTVPLRRRDGHGGRQSSVKAPGAGSARVYSEPLVETNRSRPASGLGVCRDRQHPQCFCRAVAPCHRAPHLP